MVKGFILSKLGRRPSDEEEDDKLTRREEVGVMVDSAPETVNTIHNDIADNRAKGAFLLYSFLAAMLMMFAMLYEQTTILIAIFVVYFITMMPILYIYEDGDYFNQNKGEFNSYLSNKDAPDTEREPPVDPNDDRK